MAGTGGLDPGQIGPVLGGEAVDISSSDHTISGNEGVCRALWISATGDVKVDTIDGSTLTFPSVPVGFHPVFATKVYQTGTTATVDLAVW